MDESLFFTEKKTKLNKYFYTASLAAENEKVEAWPEAAMLWVQASDLASCMTNKEWADRRADYCLYNANKCT
ncbi:ANR family transcriptional regulator [Yersinia intermedia]|uniref:ANR family transcriptional regulator n=1 Tax=Yersinia intermedia TaxID=631 RepID=UPI0005DB4254|nr:ANR family transcriptional regulator [Yersinia intermedia]CND47491.1 Uncharacterised protein [Yersinia intermedia]